MMELESKLLRDEFQRLCAFFIIWNLSFLAVKIQLKIITFKLISSVIFTIIA